MKNKADFFYEELLKKGLTEQTEEFREEFEEYYQISKVYDAISVCIDGEAGFVILEEGINFQILFLEKNEEDEDVPNVMFNQLSREEAIARFESIKREYNIACK